MNTIHYLVSENDNSLDLCKRYNITLEMLISHNVNRYPGLYTNPFMLFANWVLVIPIINNGGDTEYALTEGSEIN